MTLTHSPPAAWRVQVLAFDEVELLDLAGPLEVFTTAERVARRTQAHRRHFEVACVAATPGPVRTRAGLRVQADATLDDLPAPDLLIVPGGVVDAVAADPRVQAWLVRCHATTQITASVCTGAFVLAAAGVLREGAVTTHWEDAQALQQAYPALHVDATQRWIDQGRLVTSAGISAGIDMSLHLVQRIAGTALAQATARQMDYRWEPTNAAGAPFEAPSTAPPHAPLQPPQNLP